MTNDRVPQPVSSEEMAQLVAALDRTSLALSNTRVTVGLDGTFTLHIPIASFVVSTETPSVAPATVPSDDPTSTETPSVAPATVPSDGPTSTETLPLAPATSTSPTPCVDLTIHNIGPTPTQVKNGLDALGPDAAVGKWYCVTRGRDVGVFKHLNEVSPSVMGVPGSAHCKLDSQASALEAYTRSWDKGHIRRL